MILTLLLFVNQGIHLAKHITSINVILFDPLGCGVSDKAKDIPAEYSMVNFTEIAASVVEAVKQKLCPVRQMDLRVYGGSFGSLTAMDLPLHRSEWLSEDAGIHLRQIISHVGPNGAGDNDYTWKFVEANYKDHPRYEKIMRGSSIKLPNQCHPLEW